jgi:hypothetical protein
VPCFDMRSASMAAYFMGCHTCRVDRGLTKV